MAKIRTIQIYRGTTAQNDAYAGSAGELTMDTTTNELRLHDGSTVGGHIVSGTHPYLFCPIWSDYELSDTNWLRADTFSWQSKSAYTVAYNHLADDISGKSLSSETVAGVTIQFYLADDGHKICPDSQESNVAAIYTATGVAWYYIIDTVNERFKLPRVNADKEKFVEQVNSVPVKTSSTSNTVSNWAALKIGRATDGENNAGDGGTLVVYSNANMGVNAQNQGSTDMGESVPVNLIADFSDINSFFAGKKYLYFYVGNFTQTALENTAGLNASLFNNKADKDFGNTTMIDYVVEKQDPSAGNNYTWYRKYKSGWIEQGGIFDFGSNSSTNPWSVTLPVAMADTMYTVNATSGGNTSQGGYGSYVAINNAGKTTTTFGGYMWSVESGGIRYINWEVKGVAAN